MPAAFIESLPYKNWIMTPEGDLININYISKVRVDLTNFRVIIHQGVGSKAGGTTSGSTQAYTYVDAPTAQAAFDKIFNAINQLGVVNDLRT